MIQGWIASHAPGLESQSVDQMLPRIRQEAARKGFREIGTDNLFRDWIYALSPTGERIGMDSGRRGEVLILS